MGIQPVGWRKIQESSTQTWWLKGEAMASGDGEQESLGENLEGSDIYGTGRKKAKVWCLRKGGKGACEQSTV